MAQHVFMITWVQERFFRGFWSRQNPEVAAVSEKERERERERKIEACKT